MFKLHIHGNSDHPMDEHSLAEFLRELVAKINNNGRPSGGEGDNITHAVLEGSHTGVHNLLSNPEPEPSAEELHPTTPEPKGNPFTMDSVGGQSSTPPQPEPVEEPVA